MNRYSVTAKYSNYPSRAHNFKNCDIETVYWEETFFSYEGCCFYGALHNWADRPDKNKGVLNKGVFIEDILEVKNLDTGESIHHIRYYDPAQTYYPKGSYCPRHFDWRYWRQSIKWEVRHFFKYLLRLQLPAIPRHTWGFSKEVLIGAEMWIRQRMGQ